MEICKNKKISFVIPCYGSENTIETVTKDIIKTVQDKSDYEIICVNDCSKDNVYAVLKKIAQNNKNIKVINLAKNAGQHNAILAGYRVVSGDVVVCLDDDGQTDPKYCYKLIDALNDDVDVAIAKYPQKKENAFRLFGSWMARKMSEWMCGFPKNVVINSYFACKRFVVNEIARYENPYTYLGGLIPRSTCKIINVKINHNERLCGKSGYSLKKLVSLWMNGFTAFSVKPLRIATLMGVFVALAGFCYMLFVIVKKIISPNVPMGYSSLLCAVLFIGGMIMIMLGLLGEYVGRIYICLNKSPQYVVKETINIEECDE